MKIEDVQVVNGQLVLATSEEVDAFASLFWINLPDGYREYITRLGQGVLGSSFVRVYPPWQIEKELVEWRRRINKYWFWDAGCDLLPKDRALECVIIGDTTNGDELIFHPSRPNRLFILPVESDQIFEAGSNLLDAIEWIFSSGELVEPYEGREFEPFDSRNEDNSRFGQDSPDPEGESLDDIVELAKRWAKRHDARKDAQADARGMTPLKGKAELIYEGIHIGKSPGYHAAWWMLNRDGQRLGMFRWNKDDVSQGSEYLPEKV